MQCWFTTKHFHMIKNKHPLFLFYWFGIISLFQKKIVHHVTSVWTWWTWQLPSLTFTICLFLYFFLVCWFCCLSINVYVDALCIQGARCLGRKIHASLRATVSDSLAPRGKSDKVARMGYVTLPNLKMHILRISNRSPNVSSLFGWKNLIVPSE